MSVHNDGQASQQYISAEDVKHIGVFAREAEIEKEVIAEKKYMAIFLMATGLLMLAVGPGAAFLAGGHTASLNLILLVGGGASGSIFIPCAIGAVIVYALAHKQEKDLHKGVSREKIEESIKGLEEANKRLKRVEKENSEQIELLQSIEKNMDYNAMSVTTAADSIKEAS